MPFPLAALAPLLSIGESVLDKFFPDPESAAAAKLEFAKELSKVDMEKDSAFMEFVVAYEGAGDKVHPAIQILRGSVRPVISYSLVGFFIYGFVNPSLVEAATIDLLWKLNLISLGFWFGERSLKNLGMDLGKRNGKSEQ